MIKSFKDELDEIKRRYQGHITWEFDPDDLAHEYILRWGDVVELAEEYDLVRKYTDKDRLKEILEQVLIYREDGSNKLYEMWYDMLEPTVEFSRVIEAIVATLEGCDIVEASPQNKAAGGHDNP
jgi:hypothetical protein